MAQKVNIIHPNNEKLRNKCNFEVIFCCENKFSILLYTIKYINDKEMNGINKLSLINNGSMLNVAKDTNQVHINAF